jgi:CRP-like cAMP-binding protein
MPVQSFGRNAFLAELSGAEIALFRPHMTLLDLRLDDALHRVGDQVEHVVFPHSAVVATTLPTKDGAGAAIVLIGADGVIGATAAAAAGYASCDARVQIAGEASSMSASAFRYLLDQSPAVRRLAARFGSALLAQAQQTALCNAVHPVEARICRWLLEVQDRSGSDKVPLTQSALAQMLGVRRTTVTLIAGRLEAAGVLNGRRGYMQIVNRGLLEQHACECYGQIQEHMARLFAPALIAGAVAAEGAGRGRPVLTAPALLKPV